MRVKPWERQEEGQPLLPGVESVAEDEIRADSPLGHGLSLRQAQFVSALLEQVLGEKPQNIQPEKAAESMGIDREQARVWARMQMRSPPVRAALCAQLQAQIEAATVTPMRWLAEVGKLAFLRPPSLKQFYDEHGALRPPSEWTEEMASEVAELTSEEVWEGRGNEREFRGHRKRIRLHEWKQTQGRALEMIAKYHKLVNNTLEVVGKDGKSLFPDEQERADERARLMREQMIAALPVLDLEDAH